MEGETGYNFEPVLTEEEMNARADADDHFEEPPPSPADPVPEQLGNNNLCDCGSCLPMETVRQCWCCTEVNNCLCFIKDDIVCITRHEDFPKICLERVVLRTGLVARLDCRGHRRNLSEILDNIYTAYRLFTYWIHGYLGRGVRKVIPACAVTAICDAFPADRHYVGYKEGDDGEELAVPEEFAI